MTKVLFVVSECAPFVKTGGLADVAGALPIALAQIGTDVRVLLPGYSSVIEQIKPSETVARYEDLFGGPANLLTCKIAGLDMLILDAPHLYNREGGIYGDATGVDWPDNPKRFAALCKVGAKIAKDGILRKSNEILTQKGVDMKKIREIWPEIPYFDKKIDEQIEINAHYRGYLKKQKADILAFKRDENLVIPEKVNYDDLSGLSNEVKAKFKQIKPKTMGQALRIDGITPAAVYILLSHVKRKSIKLIA